MDEETLKGNTQKEDQEKYLGPVKKDRGKKEVKELEWYRKEWSAAVYQC
jgi:hypothetical protein